MSTKINYQPYYDYDLWEAIKNANIFAIEICYKKRGGAEFYNQRKIKMLSPLMFVLSLAKNNKRFSVRFIMQFIQLFEKFGGDFNYQDRDGHTALHFAIDLDDMDVIEYIIRRSRSVFELETMHPINWLPGGDKNPKYETLKKMYEKRN